MRKEVDSRQEFGLRYWGWGVVLCTEIRVRRVRCLEVVQVEMHSVGLELR